MITRAVRDWRGSWRRAANPDGAGDSVITRALVLVGAEMLASALLLAALTDWKLSMWSDAMTRITSLPVKGTALFAVPALYFALVASNALERATRAATRALRWVAAIAFIMSIGSALLFWALPVSGLLRLVG